MVRLILAYQDEFNHFYPMKSNTPYTPIACSFYDRIEEAIVLRKTAKLIYQTEEGTEIEAETRLKDTRTKDDAEFVVLPSGEEVRMDRIMSLDGEALLGSC